MTENTATFIDNIFSNNLQDDITSGNVLLTPNIFLNLFLLTGKKLTSKTSTFIRETTLSFQTWNYAHENVHEAFKDFYSKLEGSVSRHAPLKKLSPKEMKLKNKPWLSTDILKMIKIRNKIFARKKR